ncbi:phage tail sheath family protein [Paenibacillus bouchesdurhonensis]|uniref:phage tail sheath family protein n=1 Tax=Paenibacillus bouchesdurhonensis TaxID=1870990 RepID=UPI000DA62DB9|nr:phage tail protein [Paenibacillus bouchesdurhonensis]
MERHGIYVTEIQPQTLTPVSQIATIPVVIGTAPVSLSRNSTYPVNVPLLIESWEQFVRSFGSSDDWNSYTLCEFAYSHFRLYRQSPAVFINVLDPATHKKAVSSKTVTFSAGRAVIEDEGIILSSVKVQSTGGSGTEYVLDTDYALTFNEVGKAVISVMSGGAITPSDSVSVEYDVLDPSVVAAVDIIGGTDSNGVATGLELIKKVFPLLRVIPGLILAPGFSHDPTVAAVMTAKSAKINGHFNAMAITDVPANLRYTEIGEWKEQNQYTSKNQVVSWPKVTKSGRTFRYSTQLAGVICQLDKESDGVPYRSPSNKTLQIDGVVAEDGKPVALGPDDAEVINSEGIVTAINFIGGFKAWGNRTGAYPELIDPQNAFIPVRRMFDWWNNTIILTQWAYVDEPANKRLVEAVVDSLNIRLNGLMASGYILGGRVEFNKEDNPPDQVANGKLKFRTYITPPSPAQEMEYTVEYDASYLGSI